MADDDELHPPVIFLDLDGVVNRTRAATHIRLDDDLMARLRDLVAETVPFWSYPRSGGHSDDVQYILPVWHPGGVRNRRTPGVCEATSYANGSMGTQLFSESAFDDTQYANRQLRSTMAERDPKVTRYVVLETERRQATHGLLPALCNAIPLSG